MSLKFEKIIKLMFNGNFVKGVIKKSELPPKRFGEDQEYSKNYKVVIDREILKSRLKPIMESDELQELITELQEVKDKLDSYNIAEKLYES